VERLFSSCLFASHYSGPGDGAADDMGGGRLPYDNDVDDDDPYGIAGEDYGAERSRDGRDEIKGDEEEGGRAAGRSRRGGAAKRGGSASKRGGVAKRGGVSRRGGAKGSAKAKSGRGDGARGSNRGKA
jgi:hypothetical protein